jgi:hypothetical protein
MLKNINAIQGTTAAFIFFALTNFLISGRGYDDEVNMALTVSSFMFAILAGFFITRLNIRYDKIVESIAEEDAAWISLYQTSKIIKPSFAKHMADLIDRYYVISYDYYIGNSYKATAPIYFQVFDDFSNLKIKNTIKINAANQAFLTKLQDVEGCRNMTSIYVEQKITKGQWMALIALALIMIVCLFTIKSISPFSQLITVLLSTTIVLVLLIIHDLQLIKIAGQEVLLESGLEVFDFIGKKRYFHRDHISSGRYKIPNNVDYRVGIHKIGETPKIVLVKAKAD